MGGLVLPFCSIRGWWVDGWMGAMACGRVRIVRFPRSSLYWPPFPSFFSVPEEYGVTNNRCTRKKQTTERQGTERSTFSSISSVTLIWMWLYCICSSLYPAATSLLCFPLFRINKQTNRQTNLAKHQHESVGCFLCVCVSVSVCVCALIHKTCPWIYHC